MPDLPFALSVWTDGRPDPGQSARERYRDLLAEARLADGLGFRAFCTTEQHAVDDGYPGAQLTTLAGLAAVTSRLRLATNCLLLPLHPLRQVVEEAVAVDLLSGGRLELGVAAGGFAREFHLFGADFRARRRVMEERIPLLRQALTAGHLPDGPGGELLPVTPGPAQDRVPILVGGNSAAALDRAVRLGDGAIPYDFARPETNLPRLWRELVLPALQRHGRPAPDFRFVACTHLWVTDDPERDWATVLRPAITYQQGKYAEWAGEHMEAGYAGGELVMSDHLIGTPEDMAARLLATWRQAPWQELVFWYRIPHISHRQAMEHLERVAGWLMPLLTSGKT